MRPVVQAALAVVLFSLAEGSANADEGCVAPKQIASVAIETMPDGLVAAPVMIGGQALNFRLETESQGSFIRASTAATLGLSRERITDWNVHLYGEHLREFATADAMKLGGLTAKVRFVVAPDSDFEPGVSGTLAADFLRNFDVDFDFAKGRLNLFSPDHCPGGVVYWTQSGASRVPMQVNVWGQVTVDAQLDGKFVPAGLSTGWAESRLIMAEDEAKFGDQTKWKLKNAGESHNFSQSTTIYENVFKSLMISGIEAHNVDLTIYSGSRPVLGAYLGLGMDILRQLHLYIAYKERNLYVSAANAGAAPPASAATAPQQQTAH